jgi:hypothetical protein
MGILENRIAELKNRKSQILEQNKKVKKHKESGMFLEMELEMLEDIKLNNEKKEIMGSKTKFDIFMEQLNEKYKKEKIMENKTKSQIYITELIEKQKILKAIARPLVLDAEVGFVR